MKEDFRRALRPARIFSALAGSVCRRVALAVFATIILLDVAIIVPLYFWEKNAFIGERSRQAQALLAAAVDPSRYPGVETLIQTGESLLRGTKVTGGLVISGAGEERAVFGTPPELTWAQARLNGEISRLSTTSGSFDIFISPEQTLLPYGIILRLDVSEEWALLTEHLRYWAILSVAVAILLSLVTMIVVARQVERPLRRIRETVDIALNSPEESSRVRTGVSRSDEIGALARDVDQLLFLTSSTIVDDLAAAQLIIERSPHGILTFSEQGHLVSANPAALTLFGEKNVTDLLARDPGGLFRYGDEMVSPTNLLRRGRIVGPGEILHEDGNYPCLVAGDLVKREDGSVLRQFLMFVDMRHLVEQVRSEVKRRESAEEDSARVTAEIRLLRRMFDACLIVTELDGGDEKKSNDVTVIPEGLIDAWRSRLQSEGTPAPDDLQIADLPAVVGDPKVLRRLFDTALEVVRLRSLSKKPRIDVSGTADNGKIAEFTIRETDREGKPKAIAAEMDLTLLVGALGVLCRRQNGSLGATTSADKHNQITFRLRVDHARPGEEPKNSEAA